MGLLPCPPFPGHHIRAAINAEALTEHRADAEELPHPPDAPAAPPGLFPVDADTT